MRTKLKWTLVPLGLLALLLLAYVAAGPWLAINGIRRLVAAGQQDELWRFVDFQRLQESLRPQLEEKIMRDILARTASRSGPLAIGKVSSAFTEPAVKAMASPQGLATLLQGSALARTTAPGAPNDGLKHAQTRFQSPSLFTATVASAEGRPVVFEFRRDGLGWKLTGLRLPD
ncbi:DUF2939 domain-containing protein [Thermomonas haemolytica]|uniref:DUF2939 family protein n=1 Tax=Thermomonas haemolytica TaxID=141949 RepID=A0A4R3N5P7_9GAMM|nr:DUF2939 domain-containing protein [Thermomonas haemolytica]TCT24538.1 DUF2939 family protein [Thermomonas haemolytica]TNY29402.1 hypothetical protein BV505_04930 [Thermomonas haemolytica]